MLALVRDHDDEQTLVERDADERRRRGVSSASSPASTSTGSSDIKGAKPSTLRDHRLLLAEPGSPTDADAVIPRV